MSAKSFGLDEKELNILKKLDSPRKIQDFLDTLEINFEKSGETCLSPREVLKRKRCHCIEGAMLAALALRMHGRKPLLLDLTSTKDDYDHVVALFREDGKWGCISKSNHSAHRYREPIYRDVRELVMSIFHEYIDKKGRKTLRSFSIPVDLSKFDKMEWVTSKENLWNIHDYLDKVKHFNILNRKQIAKLRKADRIELKTGNITEWDRNGNKLV